MATINYAKPAEDCIIDGDGPNKAGKVQRLPFDHDPEKEHAQADYRDKLTFDEVAENDEDMAKYAVKNSKRYVFSNFKTAQAFMGKCVQITLNRCGLMILEGMPAEQVQKKMDKAKIQVENRAGLYRGEDTWRNGLYIFKAGELVAFVSVPFTQTPSPLAIDRSIKISVVTNAKVSIKGFR